MSEMTPTFLSMHAMTDASSTHVFALNGRAAHLVHHNYSSRPRKQRSKKMSDAGRGGRGRGGHVGRGQPKEVINHVPEEVIKHAPVARGHHPDPTGVQTGGREHHGGRAGGHGRGPHTGRGRGRGSGRGSRNLLGTVLPADAGSDITPFAGAAIVAGVALYAYKRAKKSKASRNDEACKHAEEVELTEDLV